MRINPFFSWLFLVPMCTLFLNFCVFVVSRQCLGNQQSLLLELKNNLIFDSTRSQNLLSGTKVSIAVLGRRNCNEGRVIGLDLSRESISGALDNSSSPLQSSASPKPEFGL
ncbi:hypothetical protein SLA2020_368230 [Shorea laevis]